MHHVMRSPAVRSSATTAGILAVLDVVIGLPWPVWLAWAGVTAVAVATARRATA